LRTAICRAFSGQGSLGFEDRVDPHHGDRSPQWIYPNLTDPGTSCHGFVSRHDWKIDVARRPCGVGLVSERIRPVRLARARRTL